MHRPSAIVRHCVALSCLALALAARVVADDARAPVVRDVTILATTDFHGALVSGGEERSTSRPWGGAVALAALLRQERAAHPQRTFLLDGGDEMQGTLESNLFFGRSAIAVLNAFRVDAAACGNHEFDWGIDTLRARHREMRYPLLAANVFEKRTGKRPEWLRPYTIVERDGVRLGIIGFATPETPRVTMPLNVESLRFDPPEPLVGKLVAEVRERGADLVVLVAHIGGQQNRDGKIEGPVAALARAAPGVAAVVGGHSHSFVNGMVDGVPVVIAGSSARLLGRIVLQWDGRTVRGAQTALLRAYSDSLPPTAGDPIAALVDAARVRTRPLAERPLGQAARLLRRPALANLVTDAMRSAVHADVAITNPGGLRRDLQPGPITVGDVFELMPFDNALVTMRLRGSELRQVIASRPEKVLLSGMKGRWDPSLADSTARLVLQHADGSPLRPDSTYVLVTNSFIAQGGDGFTGFEAGRETTVTPILVRDAITQAVEGATRAGRPIDPEPDPRFVVPASGRD